MTETLPRRSAAAVWILAARPKTLWASIAPVIVGTAIAWHDGAFYLPAAFAALAGAMLIQIGTNFANDLFDYEHGADTAARTGPLRVTQAGLVTPERMRAAVVVTFTFAFAVGVFLVWRGGWPIVGIGLASIAAALLYTGGPFPYGYRGLGDVFVFAFFGPVAVVGTYYVQALAVTPGIWVSSLPMGFLATAILVVNNLRDIDTDRKSGKMTLAVRLGRTGSAWEYTLLLAASMLVPIIMVVCNMAGIALLTAAAVVLFGIPDMIMLARETDGSRLNQVLARTARLQAIYALVFAIGVNL